MRPRNIAWYLACGCLLFGLSLIDVSAQQPGSSNTDSQVGAPVPVASASTKASVSGSEAGSLLRKGNPVELGPRVRIGPGDDLDIEVFRLPELSQHVRVGSSGDISLPLVGNLHVAGLSSDEARLLIERRLTDGHFVNNPQVSVNVKEYTAEGISLMGEVSRPGVYSALGAHRLEDLIETAGGLTDKAGKTVTVVRRDDLEHPRTLALSNDAARTAENNIELLPGDTIVVSKAGIVYVVGEVNKPGGFVMENDKISASHVLAMAAGPTQYAALNRTLMIRHTPEGLKNIPLPLKKLIEAQIPDIELQGDDIIWVPSSKVKAMTSTLMNTILGTALSAAIYRF
jgi:polysaccharide export outer membrane protein